MFESYFAKMDIQYTKFFGRMEEILAKEMEENKKTEQSVL